MSQSRPQRSLYLRSEHHFDIYDDPSSWAHRYPLSNGNYQSPIDINPIDAVQKRQLSHSKLLFDYQANSVTKIRNTGSTFLLPADANSHSAGHNGTEHSIGGHRFASELHLVHKSNNFETFEEAEVHPRGVCVVAVLIEESSYCNPRLKQLCSLLPQISHKGDEVAIPEGFDVKQLLPETTIEADHGFWTYNGSLTTPPFYECVLWVVLRQRILASKEQLECLRNLHCESKGHEDSRHTVGNTRPLQPLSGRLVESSFHFHPHN